MYFHRQVDIKTGKLMIGRKMGELREGAVYSGGKDTIYIVPFTLPFYYELALAQIRKILSINQSNS